MNVKFVMSDKSEISLSMEKAEAVLNSPENIVMVSENGKWTGVTINKSFLIKTVRDNEALEGTRDGYQLEEHKPDQDKVLKELDKLKSVLTDKLGV